MKSKKLYAALSAILLMSLLQIGCTTHADSRNIHLSNVVLPGKGQLHVELLAEVQRFAADNDEESASAWQDLLKRSRQSLIDDLNSIVLGMDADDRNRVLIAFTLCRLNYEYLVNRQIVLSALSKNQPYRDFGGDWAVNLVGRLMLQGDKDVLEPLFSAATWTDGAMSYELAAAYSEGLIIDADNFLNLLASQPRSIRADVIRVLEHHTLTVEEKQKVKIHLAGIPRQSQLHSLSAAILYSIERRAPSS
jgi:hypothetical protein